MSDLAPTSERLAKNTTTPGASRIGVSSIAGILSGAATTVQAALADLASQITNKVTNTRAINTTSPLSGGGNLTADRTLSLNDTAVTPGTYTLMTGTIDQKGRLTAASSGSAGAVPDASTTVKGATKLSVAPVSGTNPIAVGDNDTRLTRYGEAVFYYSGAVATKTGVGRYPIPDEITTVTIVSITAIVDTPSTSGSITVDVNKALVADRSTKTTIYTTQGNRPSIPINTRHHNAVLPNVLTAAGGDHWTVDVDAAGTGASDLTVRIRYSY